MVTSGRVTAWRRHESVATRATVVRRRRSFVTKRGGVAEVLVWKKERGSQFSWCELEQKRKNWGESWTERCKTYGETSASVCTLSLLLLYLSAYERETRFSELNAKSWQRISSILSLTIPIFFFFFFTYILFLFLSCSILYSYISVCHSKFTKSCYYRFSVVISRCSKIQLTKKKICAWNDINVYEHHVCFSYTYMYYIGTRYDSVSS